MNDLILKLPKIDRSKLEIKTTYNFNPLLINNGIIGLRENDNYFEFKDYIILIEQFKHSLVILINKLHKKEYQGDINKPKIYLKTYSYISIQKDNIIIHSIDDPDTTEIENIIREYYK